MEYPGWDQVQDKPEILDPDCVARIVAALIAGYYVEIRRENVDNFTFAFIAPLSPDYNYVLHILFESPTRLIPQVLAHCPSPTSASAIHLKRPPVSALPTFVAQDGILRRVAQDTILCHDVFRTHSSQSTLGWAQTNV